MNTLTRYVIVFLLSGFLFLSANEVLSSPTKATVQEIEALSYGLDLILHRRYDDALKHFHGFEEQHHHTMIGSIGESLIYQAKMYEGDHFLYEKAYKEAHDRTLKTLKKRSPGTAWYYFQTASIHGLEGLFHIRKEEWLSALNEGLNAVSALEKGLKIDPNFFDAHLGTGIYTYARSILGKKHWMIPLSDQRAEGISEVQIAIDKGKILPDIARMTLALIQLNEQNATAAIELTETLKGKYPENVIIRMLLGRIYMQARKYELAVKEFQDLVTLDPNQTRALYYMGRAYLSEQKALNQAETAFKRFLETNPEPKWKAYALFRLGQTEERRGNMDKAIDHWKQALNLYPDYKAPKQRIKYAEEKQRFQKANPKTTASKNAKKP